MSLSTSNFDVLKAWYLSANGGKGKQEASAAVVSNASFKQAIDAFDALVGDTSISLDTIANSIQNRDQTYIEQIRLLTQYLEAVLKQRQDQTVYEALANDELRAAIIKSFQQSAQVAVAASAPVAPATPARTANELHPAVDNALSKFSPTMTSFSFPGSEDADNLNEQDYNVVLHKLSARLAMVGSLDHFILSNPDQAALAGLQKYYSKGGKLKIHHLHINLANVAVNDTYLNAFVAALTALPVDVVNEVQFEGAELSAENVQQLVAKLQTANIAMDVILPGKFVNSDFQKQLDISCGNAIRERRIKEIYTERQNLESGVEFTAPKRTRVRLKDKTANTEIELQQQQQVEVQVQQQRAGEQSEDGELNVITYAELKKKIENRTLALTLDKCLISDLELTKAWNNWFGHVATYTTSDGHLVNPVDATPNSTILNRFENNDVQHITEEACTALLNSPHSFEFGLDYNHLPAGFKIVDHPAGKGKVLHYNEMLAQLFQQDDLAIKLLPVQANDVPADVVTKELLAAMKNHPSYLTISRLVKEVENAELYDRDALIALKKLLPTLFTYQDGLEIMITIARKSSKVDINIFEALVKYHQSGKAQHKVGNNDPAGVVLATICKDYDVIKAYRNIKLTPLTPATHHLMLVLASQHAAYHSEFQKWVKAKRCSAVELNALYDVYIAYGVEGLKKIERLSNEFNQFDVLRLSLQHGSNYLQCIKNPATSRAIEAVCGSRHFSKEELGWFHAMLQQHAATNKEFSLVDMVDAFTVFKKKIKEYKLDFYLPVAFKDVKNMTVAMCRLLSVLELTDANERAFQWSCITGLSLAADGAIHTVKNNKSSEHVCHFVTPVMQTEPVSYATSKGFEFNDRHLYSEEQVAYRDNGSLLEINKNDFTFVIKDEVKLRVEFLDREFYRYIAHQTYRRPIGDYIELLNAIKSYKFMPHVQACLYRILATSSTGLVNSYTNDKLSSEEFIGKFKQTIDLLNGLRLSVALTAVVHTFLAAPALAYKLVGKDFYYEECEAPTKGYGIESLLQIHILYNLLDRFKGVPPVPQLYYLMYFSSEGIKDAGIMRFLPNASKNNAFHIMEDMGRVSYDNHLIPFCNGMRFFTKKQIENVDECRKYIDVCRAIQSAIESEQKKLTNDYYSSDYFYDYPPRKYDPTYDFHSDDYSSSLTAAQREDRKAARIRQADEKYQRDLAAFELRKAEHLRKQEIKKNEAAANKIKKENMTEVSRRLISIISTFNLRDAITYRVKDEEHWYREYEDVSIGGIERVFDKLSSNHGLFALELLKDLDVEVGVAAGKKRLEAEDFANIIENIYENSKAENYTNKQIIDEIRSRFAAYYPAGYFDKLDADKISSEVSVKVAALFTLESDQKKCIDFLGAYRDENDIRQYDKLFAIFTHFSKRITPENMSILLDQVVILAEMYQQSGETKPTFTDYINLLEYVLNHSELNSMIYCISATVKEIAAAQSNDARLKNLKHDYINKLKFFIEKLPPLFKVNAEDALSQAELMQFISKFLHDTDTSYFATDNFAHPSIANYSKISETLFSDKAIAIWAQNPELFVERVDEMLAVMPELGFVPALLSARNHVEQVHQANVAAANAATAELAQETMMDKVTKAAKDAQTAAFSYVGNLWERHVQGIQKRPAIIVDASPKVNPEVLLAAKTAFTNKVALLKTYPGVISGVVENMRLLVNAYPATRNEIVGFIELYSANQQREGRRFEEAVANIIKLRQLLLALNNEKTAFSLLFQFNDAKDKESHSPEKLFKIINNPVFQKQSSKHQTLLLEILVKLLNNGSLNGLKSFVELVEQLDSGNAAEMMRSLGEMYQFAPYPSLEIVVKWMANLDTLSSNYNLYKMAPCRRECGVDEPNGFDLELAKEKSALITGIELSHEDDLKGLHSETLRVRELSIETLKIELSQLRNKPMTDELLQSMVAITAELLYRAKGSAPADEDPKNKKWGASFEINTTQYLGIYSLLKRGIHVTGQIETGEGKTRIMMILLACQFSMGKTVDFITSDISLANREFTEFQSYFDLLGAESRLIHADSPAQHYAIGGINFSDPASIELFRNHAHSEGKSKYVLDPVKERRACMLDEAIRQNMIFPTLALISQQPVMKCYVIFNGCIHS